MKTNCAKIIFSAVLSFAAFSTAGGAENEKDSRADMPPGKEPVVLTTPPANGEPAKTGPSAEIAAANWIDIKDCTYDTRSLFFSGLKQLEVRVDEQIRELTARRAAMTSDVNTKDWDFAMKEMGDARSFLKSVATEMNSASADTWSQQKDAVGRAWLRTQAAYDKVKSNTTG